VACPNDILDVFNPTAVVSCGTDVTAQAVTGSAFESIVNYFARGASNIVYGLTMGWMDFPTPDLSGSTNADGYEPARLDGTTTGTQGPVYFLQESMGWVTAWVAVLCLLLAAGRMMWQHRAEPAKEALQGLFTLVLVSSGGVAFIQVATRAGDSFSTWVVARSLGCDAGEANGCQEEFGKRLLKLIALDAQSNMLAITFVIALLLIISSYIQMALLIARNAMLILCAGTLPLAAAASGTEAGRGWFRKQLGWTVAFILFKPTAAVVYAAAFAGMGQGKAGDTWTQLYGVTLLLLAGLTLPALMRFVTPLVSAAAIGGAGAGAAVAGGMRAVATGAVAVKTMGGSTAAKSGAGAAAAGAQQTGGGKLPTAPVPAPVPAAGQSGAPNGGQSGGGQGGTKSGNPQAQPASARASGPGAVPAASQPSGGRTGQLSAPPQQSTPTTNGGGPRGSV
jgi:hypothetical protein